LFKKLSEACLARGRNKFAGRVIRCQPQDQLPPPLAFGEFGGSDGLLELAVMPNNAHRFAKYLLSLNTRSDPGVTGHPSPHAKACHLASDLKHRHSI